MSGFLRVDNLSPDSDERIDEYLSDTRGIHGLVHVFNVEMSSGDFTIDDLATHETRLDAGSSPVGRFQSVTADVLSAITDRLFGTALHDKTTGGLHKFAYFQPFAFPPYTANAIDIQSLKELKYLIDWATTTSQWGNIASGTDEHRVYASVADELPEVYIPRIDRNDVDLSGSGDREDVTFQENVAYVALREKDGTEVIGDVRVQRDGETVYDDVPGSVSADVDPLDIVTRMFQTPDVAASNVAPNVHVLNVLQGQDPESALASTVNVEIEGAGSGDVDVFALSADYQNSRSDRSLSRTISRLDSRRENTGLASIRQRMQQLEEVVASEMRPNYG
jgi:hypothetical protein